MLEVPLLAAVAAASEVCFTSHLYGGSAAGDVIISFHAQITI